MLFIFFNGGGLTKEQWNTDPYNAKNKSNLITKIKKLYGQVYLYTPNFTFDQKNNYSFVLEDLNLETHCNQVYNDVLKLDDEFFIISHSRGWMFAHVFINLYYKNVKGYINLDGGYTDLYFKNYLKENKKYDGYTNDDLQDLLNKFNNKKDLDAKKEISNIVSYNIFKQYKKTSIDKKLKIKFGWYILNNIYNNDEINLQMKDYVETTLDDKIKFNEKINNEHQSIKSMYFINKTHFLYFDITDIILDVIKIILWKDI